jgi:hypothetical protein
MVVPLASFHEAFNVAHETSVSHRGDLDITSGYTLLTLV